MTTVQSRWQLVQCVVLCCVVLRFAVLCRACITLACYRWQQQQLLHAVSAPETMMQRILRNMKNMTPTANVYMYVHACVEAYIALRNALPNKMMAKRSYL